MGLALYRQASLAIAKRYISKLVEQINFYEPSSASDPTSIIAMGAGHSTRMLLTTYAIDCSYPTQLQPELLELYLRLSTLWQQWNERYYRDQCCSQGLQRLLQPRAPVPSPRPEGCSKKRRLGAEEPGGYMSDLPAKRQCLGPASPIVDFQYKSQYKVLLCLICESALQTTEIAWYRHLRTVHKILGPVCKARVQQFAQYELARPEDITPPLPCSPAITGLRLLKGYRCEACAAEPFFYTVNEKTMHRHVSDIHQLQPQRAKQAKKYTACLLQTFFKENRHIRYFEVVQ